ncbi:hypothetical protein RTG_02080 [Rhodotorula toruloides ATCC 204091]|uniref:P-loop containing nucleoside triphosphate hydrolase protein n=1 Tax=Rhodotorula toruloides TaxID=5286 RepID=A0A0K3C5Z9_RHOTO|nr:hypothetical protein RTG_02080 [Rhodotorula toruloides ATCC 204091]PRQ76659.1 hypothetical protein AAT19DRAFT_12077 [Rhodotorula toruloides]
MSPDASFETPSIGSAASVPASSTSSSSRPSNIILWVHPRSTSTAFECMLLARPDEFEVLHEPMGETWYYSKERVSKRFDDKICDESGHGELSYAKAWAEVAKPHPTMRKFSKDMAQYLIDTSSPNGTVAASFNGAKTTPNNPTLIPTSELLQPHISHTFLIRHPNKAVPSYARLCYPGAPTGFDYFDPSEMGYKELRMLFDFIREKTGKTPLLVESEELLKAPSKVVKAWCEHVGIEFKQEMLEWDDAPETRTHFEKWKGFHDDAAKSKGIGQTTPDAKEGDKPAAPKKETTLSPELQKAADDCMEDYEYLRSFAKKDF